MKFRIIPVTPFQQNCSLLICEQTGKAAIVDPGGDIELIQDAIVQEAVTPECILITHGHLDHVGATAELTKRLAVPVLGPHKSDQFWLDAIPSQCKSFGFPASQSFSPSRWLSQGDSVTVGQEIFEVLHCPGHTPGHIVFFQRAAKLAVVGDVLFRGSIGRTDLPKGDYQTLIKSIKNKLWPLGKEVAFIPGHGPMSTFGEEMLNNPFVKIEQFQ
ncbi:MAG: MBL fold metallo-hydrolase [Gammaproteobacteria bacterium]